MLSAGHRLSPSPLACPASPPPPSQFPAPSNIPTVPPLCRSHRREAGARHHHFRRAGRPDLARPGRHAQLAPHRLAARGCACFSASPPGGGHRAACASYSVPAGGCCWRLYRKCHPPPFPRAVFGHVHAEDGWGVRWRPLPGFISPCDGALGAGGQGAASLGQGAARLPARACQRLWHRHSRLWRRLRGRSTWLARSATPCSPHVPCLARPWLRLQCQPCLQSAPASSLPATSQACRAPRSSAGCRLPARPRRRRLTGPCEPPTWLP